MYYALARATHNDGASQLRVQKKKGIAKYYILQHSLYSTLVAVQYRAAGFFFAFSEEYIVKVIRIASRKTNIPHAVGSSPLRNGRTVE